MRRALAVLVALALAPPATAQEPATDLWCSADDEAPATVLVLRPGYFALGDKRSPVARRACRYFAARGLRAVSVAYPNRDFFGGLGYVRRTAARVREQFGGLVYAYGESAGGTYASLLAQERQVEAAVAVSAPSDLVTWSADNRKFWEGVMGLTVDERRRGSPVHRQDTSAPLLLLASRGDDIVPFDQAVALHEHLDATSTLRELVGEHLADQRRRPWALRWLRASGSGPGSPPA